MTTDNSDGSYSLNTPLTTAATFALDLFVAGVRAAAGTSIEVVVASG